MSEQIDNVEVESLTEGDLEEVAGGADSCAACCSCSACSNNEAQ